MKNNSKESTALYSFCPLLAANGDARTNFVIDETDLAKVSNRKATMIDRRTEKPFHVRLIKRRGVHDHVLCEATGPTQTFRTGATIKIAMEESLAAKPKFILEVKNGVILFLNEHTPYPDGWYWRTDAGPFIGPFESIDDAAEAATIASNPGVEIRVIDTGGQITKAPHDPPGGHVPKRTDNPMDKVGVNLALDELERRGLIHKNGDFRKGSPVYAAVDCELEELPEGLTLLQQNLFRYLQAKSRDD